FYGEVLALPRNEHLGHEDWVEYETPNVTLAVMTPETHDDEFTQLPPATIALRVPNVATARETLLSAGLEGREVWESGACRGGWAAGDAGGFGGTDPAGNRILLHRRYAPYDDGTPPS